MQRHTQQRTALWQVIQEAGRPLSPEEMLRWGRRKVPSLGIATVYRTIKALVQERRLKPVTIPGQPDRYEPAHLEHHHHFYCRKCERVFEMEGCPVQISRLAPKGFRVESHDVILYGLCNGCK